MSESEEKAPAGIGELLQRIAEHSADTEIKELPVVGLDRAGYAGRCSVGDLVKIRPCDPAHGDKTYLGVYLGTFAIGAALATKKGERQIVCKTNPAILVPALKKVIFGAESWWGRITDVSELQDITNEEIDSLWYVQALKAQAAAQVPRTD